MLRKLNSEELKKIQLEILDNVVSFCEKNNINYWIDSGTLLGAVRHKGYIPWDDDIDLGMFREDYEKFMALFNKENERYKFYCYENNREFYYPYGKVLDTQTVFYEPDEENGNKLCINIDIFVYDNAPDNMKKLKKMFDKRDKYRSLNDRQLFGKSTFKNGNIVKRILKIVYYYILNLFPKGYFIKKIVLNSKKYVNYSMQSVGNFTGYNKFTGNKKIFENFIKMEFEGKMYNAPVRYDEWLTNQYGNYMQLPPKEERVSHHFFVAYKKEE